MWPPHNTLIPSSLITDFTILQCEEYHLFGRCLFLFSVWCIKGYLCRHFYIPARYLGKEKDFFFPDGKLPRHELGAVCWLLAWTLTRIENVVSVLFLPAWNYGIPLSIKIQPYGVSTHTPPVTSPRRFQGSVYPTTTSDNLVQARKHGNLVHSYWPFGLLDLPNIPPLWQTFPQHTLCPCHRAISIELKHLLQRNV